MAFRCVSKGINQRVPFQGRLDNSSLRAGTTAVNKPNFLKTGPVRFANILVYDGADIPWLERMEVESTLDRHTMRRFGGVGLVDEISGAGGVTSHQTVRWTGRG